MRRRNFLKCIACGLSGFAAGGGLVAGGFRYGLISDNRCAGLPHALSGLHDARFLRALPELSIAQLLVRLEAAGAYSRGCFDVARLSEDAERHEVRAFDGFYYTEPELALYALIARFGAEREAAVPAGAIGGEGG